MLLCLVHAMLRGRNFIGGFVLKKKKKIYSGTHRFALLICFKHKPSHPQTHKLKTSKYFHVELEQIISHLLFFKLGLFTS